MPSSLIRYRGNDVILFHILDPAEIDFSFEDASSFEDLESGEQLPVVPDALREQYRAMIREHIAALTTKSAAAAGRLQPAEHRSAARLRVVQLHGDQRSPVADSDRCRFSRRCSSLVWPPWPCPS